MASIYLGRFNGSSTNYGDYHAYFQYDAVSRSGTTITLNNARLYFERIGSGWTSNRLATSGSIAGQINWSNITLNPSGTQSPATMTYSLGTVNIVDVPYTTSTIGLEVQAKGTGASSLWSATSGTVQLNFTGTIAVPVITISEVTATNGNIGSASSININRFSSSFTHNLYYKFAGQSSYTLIASGVATSYGWTIPTSVYALIPNATSISCEILCETYNGVAYIGSASTTMTATVDATTNAPTVSAVITDVNTLTASLTGDASNKIVKYISNARTQITATGKNSATISSVKVTCGDGKTASILDSTLNAVESGLFTVEATDSRGLKSTATYNKTLVNYTKLTLNPLFYRTQPTNGEIALTFNGNYFNDTFGSVVNTLLLKYRYKEKGLAFTNPTLTIANPCVVTFATHGLANGTPIVFTTTGALPTGLVANTIYYVRSVDTNTFNLYDTSAHAIAGGTTGRKTTTGSQSGVHSLYKTLTVTLNGNTYNHGATPIVLGSTFNYEKAYGFEMISNDKIYSGSEIISTPTVARGIPNHWWNKLKFQVEELLQAVKGIYISSTAYISLTSTDNPLQIGLSNGANMVMDSNEIMARNNGANSPLYLNHSGGIVYANASPIVKQSDIDACRVYRNGDYSLVITGAYNNYPTYPFNVEATNINSGNMAVNSNGIKILRNCSFVLISAILNIDLVNEAVQIHIVRNGSAIFTFDSSIRNNMSSIEVPPFLSQAGINDIFTITVGASAGRTYLTRGARSSLQIEIIK